MDFDADIEEELLVEGAGAELEDPPVEAGALEEDALPDAPPLDAAPEDPDEPLLDVEPDAPELEPEADLSTPP